MNSIVLTSFSNKQTIDEMDHLKLSDSNEMPSSGRKGKSCSMFGCYNTQYLCPNLSFFRFPKELSRAKEWLAICERPDLLRRIDIGDITISNHYVCETHFPNQIVDYLHKKVLLKMAKPLSMAELKEMSKQNIDCGPLSGRRHQRREYDVDEFDDEKSSIDYSDVESSNRNGTIKRQLNGTIDESTKPKRAQQNSLQIKRQRINTHADESIESVQSLNHGAHTIDENWWKNYFEQKLKLERMRMEKEDERHTDRMNFQKMAIMLQERTEKIKIEAINNLTNALVGLQEPSKKL